MSDLSTRSFQPGDEPVILALWERTLTRDPVSPGRFQRMVLLDPNFDPAGARVAVTEGGEVVGFLLALVRRVEMEGVGLQPELGWISAFFVASEHQRRGVGTRLVEEGIAFCRERGRTTVLVSNYTPHYFMPGVDVDAYPGALSLLSRLGFRETGRVSGMSRRLLDFPLPESARETEARLAGEGITVEALTPARVGALLAFLTREFPGDWPRLMRERLGGGMEGDETIVACRDAEVIGYCHTQGERFGPFGVAADARGGGLGTALFHRGVQSMRARGLRHMWLAWTGGAAQRFYERHGLTVDRTHALMRLDVGRET
jgi:mycothiol synthase